MLESLSPALSCRIIEPMAEPQNPEKLVEVRAHGTVMRLDLAALVTMIQQRTVDASAEARGELTGGEWRRLGALELYRALRPDDVKVPTVESKPEPAIPPLARAEQNLADYFNSLAVRQLRLDAVMSVIAAGLAAALSVLVHHYVLILLLCLAGWGASYLLTVQVLYRGWISRVRTLGFKRLPWGSRALLVVAIALPGYLLVASVMPELPGETLFRWIDGLATIFFAGASAVVWAFRVETGRMKRVFEVSKDVESRS
jgi:hypothetical protein